MANRSHCPLSRCLTEPGYCQERAAPSTTVELMLIVAVPILIAILAPGVARSGKRIYMGTANPGGGSASYCEELLNESWRHANVALSVRVAKAFLTRFPSFDFDAW